MSKYPWELPPDPEDDDTSPPDQKPASGDKPARTDSSHPETPPASGRETRAIPGLAQPRDGREPAGPDQTIQQPVDPPGIDPTIATPSASWNWQATRQTQPPAQSTPGQQPTVGQQADQTLPQGRQSTRQNRIPPQYVGQPQSAQTPTPTNRPATPQTIRPRINWLRVIFRTMMTLVMLGVLGVFLLLLTGIIGYAYIANQLPPAEELKRRQFQFRTSTIYDRNGNVLWEINDPNFGRRTDVVLHNIAPDLRNATIATEDRNFYLNVGVDPFAIGRAVYYNVTEGSIVSGGSTITQQLVRNVLLSQEERTEQTILRKVKEAVLAVEVANQYSKNDILEIYLNQIYYGNLAYGIEAAGQTYFGKAAKNLTLAEAALLAGLPQSPAVHDPYTNPEGAKARQEVVLGLMVEDGYITRQEAEAAAAEPILENLRDLSIELEAPHLVTMVRAELEALYPSDLIYQSGLRIETTLDKRLQSIAEEAVAKHVDALAGRNVTNGALVALDAQTGEVLALVGSKDFRNEAISGQVNMATAPRQPGSSIKPLVYLAAFEAGWTPSTLIMDVPVEYPDGAGGIYKPVNYDSKFHGPTLLRQALANSFNIPAVKTLEFVGVETLKAMAARLGVTSLTRNDYGLALALGGGEIPLIELTGAYQAIANGGVLVRPRTIRLVQDKQGRDITPFQSEPQRVLSEEHAYLMTHILADNQARSVTFGPNSVLNLTRPAAAKTGTTNDFRDNLVLGFTPDIVAGVWVGNADYTPMQGTSGLSGAGPIWHEFMERAHEGLPVRDFVRPPGIVEMEVCADSGTQPSEVCPQRRKEIFAADQPPPGPEHDVHQMIDIDLNTNKRANQYCRTNVESRYYRVYPPDGREWANSQGIPQPPLEFCPSAAIDAQITAPADGETVRGTIPIEGRALAADFSYYEIEYGVGTGPQAFGKVTSPQTLLVEGGLLAVFDTTQFDNGPYTLRLVVYDQHGGGLESRVRILIDNPPTPTPTPTETPTALPTHTPTPTDTPAPNTPTPAFTLTPTPQEPTPVPIVTDTPTPTVVPSNTPIPATPTSPPTEIPPEETETPSPVPTETETPVPPDKVTPQP